MSNSREKGIPSCSFCGRSADTPGIGQLISGPSGVNICSDCVQICENMLKPGKAPELIRQDTREMVEVWKRTVGK